MSDRYFIDTSVWIDYFRDPRFGLGDVIDALIQDDRVAVNGIVLTELLTGAKGTREFGLLSATLGGLLFLDMPRAFFERAGRHGRLLKSSGISLPMSDLLIATHCLEHDLVLIEKDRHFEAIAKHVPLRRFDHGRSGPSGA